MDIDRRGRESAHWTIVAAPPDGQLEVSFDDGGTWTPMQRVDATTVRILVAGPEADGENPAGTVTLRLERHYALIRSTANPEVPCQASRTHPHRQPLAPHNAPPPLGSERGRCLRSGG